jgi:hypothetical protein
MPENAMNGGGIWFCSWMKLADMAESDASLVEWDKVNGLNLQQLDLAEIVSVLPTQIKIMQNGPTESSIELSEENLRQVLSRNR